MANPVPEDIAATIVERIEDGTYTSPYKITKVVRPNRQQTNASIEHLECRVQFAGAEPNFDYTHDGNPIAQGFTFHFDCGVFLRPSDEDETPLDAIAFTVLSDLTKAITTPNATWHNWGGKAINSDYTWGLGMSVDGSTPAAILTIHAHTRFDIDDPTNFRT